MEIRTVNSSDYDVLSSLINEWWGGRQFGKCQLCCRNYYLLYF
ncbi:hypothetical protein [Salicibibacter cibi]|nr:hypothetical protein [Salicibibacter cibi]